MQACGFKPLWQFPVLCTNAVTCVTMYDCTLLDHVLHNPLPAHRPSLNTGTCCRYTIAQISQECTSANQCLFRQVAVVGWGPSTTLPGSQHGDMIDVG
jgi:hypothetical protein